MHAVNGMHGHMLALLLQGPSQGHVQEAVTIKTTA
jgi:hypothetical protein